ncbi:MAG: MFS transporter [Candidatus Eremiobacteraeota bacterium]|nr:MFS transporter [Candidatus Eremiobacteraeota bacterium]
MNSTAKNNALFADLDNSGITKFHWMIMFVSGMGFFTDAYDLFIIGVALVLMKEEWHLSAFYVSVLGSTSLLAAAFGAAIFGRIADLLGRKRIYGYEVLVLAVGAIASAFAPSFWWLVLFRFILGVGIGGDYPVSATIMSEYAGSKVRGMLISLVFAMQGLGLICGPLVAIALLASGVSHDLAWRIMLGLGAIPALSVFYLRRRIHETPRFSALAGQMDEVEAASQRALGLGSTPTGEGPVRDHKKKWWSELRVYRADPVMLRWLIGASVAWFLLDVAYYGNTLSSPLVVKAINSHASLITNTTITLGIFVVAAFPGYFVAAMQMDRLGRKLIQALGFLMMALAFGAIALLPGGSQAVVPFIFLYGLSYFFTEFGPNTTTFVYPAEIFPARVRTTSHGITATSGKIGAFIGTFAFPMIMAKFGLSGAMGSVAVVAIAGMLVTWLLLPEPKGKSLEEISRDDLQSVTERQDESVIAKPLVAS